MTPAWNRRFFDAAALYYDLATARLAEWRDDCRGLGRDLDGGTRKVLDLGTGPGVSAFEVAQELSPVAVLGIDVSHAMLRRAIHNRRRYPQSAKRVAFTQADAAHLPLRRASVDAITTHSFLYLVSDRRAVLREIRRVLRPGGVAVFFEPRQERASIPPLRTWARRPIYAWTIFLWGVMGRFEGAFRDGELAELARDAGLRIRAARSALEGYAWKIVAESAA